MVTVTQQKCACADCVCIVDMKDAVKEGDRNYCSEACAKGHPTGAGCEHTGCVCRG
ncbi:MAG: metallothionein [Alphaproteobacteria bacterium]|nr:metallothionein [Alphaproteobacteria bacterium]